MKILVTGALGFIGQATCSALVHSGKHDLLAAARIAAPSVHAAFPLVYVGNVSSDTDWSNALLGVDVVVHLAARAHGREQNCSDPLFNLRSTNVSGTLALANQAIRLGVRRFIFISSIGVHGNTNKSPFKAGDPPSPAEPYAQSKWEAEQALTRLTKGTDMDVVIIRPPLVYGANAPGNFGALVRWVEKGVPLPLGAIDNKRSLVSVDNLVDLILRCIDHPAAANRVFLAGDGVDLSTTELLDEVGQAMGKPARLIPMPGVLLQLGATLLGKKALAQRLLGSLQVDISETCEILDWKPPYSVQEGLRRCFNHSN